MVLIVQNRCHFSFEHMGNRASPLSRMHRSLSAMAAVLTRTLLTLLLLSTIQQKAGGEFEQWCVADEQSPDDELQMALDWACGGGGANCSKIQGNQSCFYPNTVKDHASFAFNSYFQNFKHHGGSCFFKGAAIITETDPSHNSCQYEFIP
ncbi:glucan endo-1,3-beta-glucosidase 1-like isoform X2 [Momordica charantia]|uniref:Glucan endo-1,3-beta-glucosidase 1-like isoform X2 n=1 Tax=Momordica charantia TaxID=3673 RepID=A0A6J1CGI9_MOMCH|nr:glucan endo-1,3-beta-glucosidase 1-like isoform X2 [Momordica charantia]